MNTKNSFVRFAIGVAGASTLFLGFALSASAATHAPKKDPTSLAAIIAKSDTAITKKIASLQKVSSNLATKTDITSSEETALAAQTQAEITALTTLKSKIDADTTVAMVRADAKFIDSSFKDVVKTERMVSASSRVTRIVSQMSTLQTKLETRITAAQSAGKDVSALTTANSDITAKLADATTQVATAKSSGTVSTAVTTALSAARADLAAARTDIQTILAGLKVGVTSK